MRLLSPYEAVVVSRANHHIYYTFAVGAKYNIELNKEKVLDALTLICQQYPHFSLRVGEGFTCDFTKSKYTIDETYIDSITSDLLEEKLAYYNSFKFDYTIDQPLWKLVYVTDINSLYFIVDHTYFDGTASRNFHESFSQKYNNEIATREVDPTVFNEYPDPTVLMGFESRKATPSIAETVEPIVVDIDEEKAKQPMVVHRKKLINLGLQKTNHLLSVCRENNIKITGLMYAIASKSLTKAIPNSKDKAFKTMIPINTRPANAPHDVIQYGMFFGKYFHTDTTKDIANTNIFKLAQSFQKLLVENIPKAMDDYQVFQTNALNDPKLVDSSMQAMADRNNKPISTIAMSNIGVINSAIIDDVYFDQPLVDAYFALHIVSSNANGMTLNFESHRGISLSTYESYISNTLELLYSL